MDVCSVLVWGYLPMSDGGHPCVKGCLFSRGLRPVCCCGASGWDWQARGTTVGYKAKGSTDSRVTRNNSTCKTPFNFHHSSVLFFCASMLLYILNASFISTNIKAAANMQREHIKHSDRECTMQTMHIVNQFQAM